MIKGEARLRRRLDPFVPTGERSLYAFRAERPSNPWWALPAIIAVGLAAIALPGPNLFGWIVFSVGALAVFANVAERRLVLITTLSVIVVAERWRLAFREPRSLALVARVDPADLSVHRYAGARGWAKVTVADEELLVMNDRMGRTIREVDRALGRTEGD